MKNPPHIRPWSSLPSPFHPHPYLSHPRKHTVMEQSCFPKQMPPCSSPTGTPHRRAPNHLPRPCGRGKGCLAPAQAEAMLVGTHLQGSSAGGSFQTHHPLERCPGGTDHPAQVPSFKSISPVIAKVHMPTFRLQGEGPWGTRHRCTWAARPEMPFRSVLFNSTFTFLFQEQMPFQ